MQSLTNQIQVRYGDTDSLHVSIPREKASELESLLNSKLQDYCKNLGIEPLLKVSFEKYVQTEVFVESKKEGKAAKKYYVLRIREIDGKPVDSFDWRGFDRRDSSRLGRKVRKEVAKMIAYDRISEIKPYLIPIIQDIKAGKYKLRDVCMNIGLHKDPEKYPEDYDYVRGAKYANEFLGLQIRGGDYVKVVPVKKIIGPPTDVICVLDESQVPDGTVVDYDKLLYKTFELKLESLLKVCGIEWSSLLPHKSLAKVYVK